MNMSTSSTGVRAGTSSLAALVLVLSLAVLSEIAWAPIARAQSFRGSIVGTVLDETQAPVPGATVTAKNQATGLARTIISDEAGNYAIPQLPVGPYTVSVTKSGFQTVSRADVSVDVAAERRVDLTLNLARVQQTVEVTAQVPLVSTTEDTLGGTLVSNQVQNLPVNGRDYTKLIFLNPGVAWEEKRCASGRRWPIHSSSRGNFCSSIICPVTTSLTSCSGASRTLRRLAAFT
jgi:Carboxypeptidase regulatory-like domain